MRLHNGVIRRFMDDPDGFEPVFLAGDDRTVFDWCDGFMFGTQFNTEEWDALLAEEPDWFTPFIRLGTEEGMETTEQEDDADRWAAEVVPALLHIHDQWRKQRQAQPSGLVDEEFVLGGARQPIIRETPKVGRNDPPSGRPSIAPRGAPIDDEASDNAYRDAFSLLKAGQYDESIAAFSGFLDRFPNSQYADNAQYWLAETYYVKRDYESALIEYQKLIELYPASKKQSHAMLKIGYSYYELGQYDQARAVLEDLRNRYAGSTAARLAEERITILANSPQ
jgi:tol-pal system protein YbgF